MFNKEKMTAIVKLIVNFKNDLFDILTENNKTKLDRKTKEWLKKTAIYEPDYSIPTKLNIPDKTITIGGQLPVTERKRGVYE